MDRFIAWHRFEGVAFQLRVGSYLEAADRSASQESASRRSLRERKRVGAGGLPSWTCLRGQVASPLRRGPGASPPQRIRGPRLDLCQARSGMRMFHSVRDLFRQDLFWQEIKQISPNLANLANFGLILV